MPRRWCDLLSITVIIGLVWAHQTDMEGPWHVNVATERTSEIVMVVLNYGLRMKISLMNQDPKLFSRIPRKGYLHLLIWTLYCFAARLNRRCWRCWTQRAGSPRRYDAWTRLHDGRSHCPRTRVAGKGPTILSAS